VAEHRGGHHAQAYGGADGDVADHVGVADADHVHVPYAAAGEWNVIEHAGLS
jgi:hypothetical protein